jgi:NTE family protein
MSAEILRRVPLFAGFDDEELAAVSARCVERRYEKGDVVWRAGDEGDEFVVVASGRLEVWGVGPDGDEQLIGQLEPGECAGEVALLLDERRSATLTCARSAVVLALPKPDFREIVHRDARALVQVTELLSRRALALAQRKPVRQGTTVLGVVADPGVKGASLVAATIAEMAGHITDQDALLVDGSTLGLDGSAGGLADAVEELVQRSSGVHRLVVVDLPATPAFGPAVGAAFDVVVSVGRDDEPRDLVVSPATRVVRVLNRFAGAPARPINHGEPYVLPFEPAIVDLPRHDQARLLARQPTLAGARPLYRLTRKLFGVSVGVALGAGASFGIAHVGVLMALEEAGIDVDLIAGSSMGSVIGAGYAAGMRAPEMIATAHRMGNLRTVLTALDPAFFIGGGLLRGKRYVKLFKPLVEAETFDDLVMPYRAVAVDLSAGERIAIGTGTLEVAMRASAAVPIVFEPVKIDGRMLVDGGMIDPVPAEIVRDMGADIVLSVNVVPKVERGVETSISRLTRRVNRVNPLNLVGVGNAIPDIIDVVMNMLQTTWHELGTFKALSADVRIDVDLAGYTWVEFNKAAELVERGHLAGKAAVDELQELISRQLR